MYRRIERSDEALNPSSLDLIGACPRAGVVRMGGDKLPIFIIADRGTGQRYVIPSKAADESTIRLPLANCQQESLTVYTDSFRAYEPLEADDVFDREYVVYGDSEYADGKIHVNTCESHAPLTRRWLSPHRGVSRDKLTQYLRALQLRRELYRKPGETRSNTLSKQFSEINKYATQERSGVSHQY